DRGRDSLLPGCVDYPAYYRYRSPVVRASPALVRHHVHADRNLGRDHGGHFDRLRRWRFRPARRTYLPGNGAPHRPDGHPGPGDGQYPGAAKARETLEDDPARDLRALGADRRFFYVDSG